MKTVTDFVNEYDTFRYFFDSKEIDMHESMYGFMLNNRVWGVQLNLVCWKLCQQYATDEQKALLKLKK